MRGDRPELGRQAGLPQADHARSYPVGDRFRRAAAVRDELMASYLDAQEISWTCCWL